MENQQQGTGGLQADASSLGAGASSSPLEASSLDAGVQDTQMGDASQQQWLNKAALYEILAMGLRLPTPELATALLSGEFADALAEIGSVNRLDEVIVKAAAAQLDAYSGSVVADGATAYSGSAAAADSTAANSGNATADSAAAADSAVADSEDEAVNRLFHRLRACYTGLLVGAPEPAVSPYAGVWWARAQGVEPLLFVNRRSMDIERFMRSVGIGQAEGKNEPLDHIATMLEFLQYTAMVLAGVAEQPAVVTQPATTAQPAEQPAEQPAVVTQPATAEQPATTAQPTAQPTPPAPPTSLPALITVETHDRFIADYLADWVPQFSTNVSEKTDEPLYLAIASVLIESIR